jgi:hypothetical protein
MEGASKQLLRSAYPVRDPYASEDEFFRRRPEVAGYAAGDGAVVLNPHSGLPDSGKQSVALNEAARLRMMDAGSYFQFPLERHQQQFFSGSEYGSQPQMARHSVMARIIAGDPSAGPYTDAQRAAAESVLAGLLIGSPPAVAARMER